MTVVSAPVCFRNSTRYAFSSMMSRLVSIYACAQYLLA
ncbi:MAG: DUF4149 domain-containing protein [Deltaproteobacteria bacterium]|nr:DUF4149 domain-containing protein [Deltaproteobacteria bacterium]